MAHPADVTDSDFQKLVLDNERPALVDFWAPWCGPCRMVAPIVEDLAAEFEGKIAFFKVNTDDNPITPSNYGIRGIPTLILFKNGKEVDRIVGAARKDAIKKRLEALL